MSASYDIIVLGLGAMGSAAAWQLARRGVRVLGLEQFDVPHGLGSSHGHTRMTRTAYYEHPDYVPLLRRANGLWRELEAATGTSLLHQVGGVYVGPEGGEVVPGSLRSAREHGLPHTLLSNGQLAARYPQFKVPADYIGIHEPAAGYLLVENAVAAQALAALQCGAELRARERVIEWHADDEGVEVRSDKGRYRARHLVVTAGPWAGRILRDLEIRLNVTRQVLAWFWPADPRTFGSDAPVWGLEAPGQGLFYGFPMRAEVPGVKVALHAPGQAADPDGVSRAITEDDVTPLREFLARALPAAVGPLLSVKVCLYTNSPDQHFILGPHPRYSDVVLAAGFSGHGFKFAPVIGEALADLVVSGGTKLPIGFLSPKRFLPGVPS